ncbi:response regulator transcription factor [Spirosoma montaniterrae]|uniref:LuxR family transcriptional regulator n=1 Tax=Spirosoma montaniterrae TaxID=1178516 RepID=A0A1P9X215_9BACT|nr:response regulator transcription factor [Spirosoma montaniterrae]AQG81661.1 hypothetical protein AWR27_21535 [Spirosoma montaniterrae]
MTDTPKIRILLVDDHVLFNDGLVLQLSYEGSPVEVVGQVFRADDVLHTVQRLSPQVVLMDINLPQQTGIECAQMLLHHFPALHIVMLTMYNYRKFIDECRALGVSGYMLKHERIETIVETIQRVWAGERVFPDEPSGHQHETNWFVREFGLTPTEIKIIGLIRQGLSSQQIAGQLFVSFETVRSHRKNIYRKLNIDHVAKLLDFANEHGI